MLSLEADDARGSYATELPSSGPTPEQATPVNAYTGAFLYPFGAQGQSGDSVYKRCQVDGADVSATNYPNATYYAEGQYVTPDDAAAGNGTNNASWRPQYKFRATGKDKDPVTVE